MTWAAPFSCSASQPNASSPCLDFGRSSGRSSLADSRTIRAPHVRALVDDTGSVSDDRFVWRPDAQVRSRARLTAFLEQCGLDSFEALHRRSVEDVSWFTEQVLHFLGIDFDPPYQQMLDLSRGPEWSRWCVGGGLNISRMCVDRHRASRPREPAILWEARAVKPGRLVTGSWPKGSRSAPRGFAS